MSEQGWTYECGECGYYATDCGTPIEAECPSCEAENIVPTPNERNYHTSGEWG